MKNEVYGNLQNIKHRHVDEISLLYDVITTKDKLIATELLEKMAFYTMILNKEIVVYINRQGIVTYVAIGENSKASLTYQGERRSDDRLSKIRCIHTHPNGSSQLSALDCSALVRMSYDCMVVLGVKEGQVEEITLGLLDLQAEKEHSISILGPLNIEQLEKLDFAALLDEIDVKEKKLSNNPHYSNTEKTLLIGTIRRGESEEYIQYSMLELKRLAEAAGAEVVSTMSQKISKPDAAFYVGSGFVQEIAHNVQSLHIDSVIFNTEISGSQLRNLEEQIGTKIIDRTMLILDIFAQRAKTREGKLQVELAQMQYLMPRLSGKGREMSRLGGGIGTRFGSGETRLEKDKRNLRDGINELKTELEMVDKQRSQTRRSRSENIPVVAIVGYTNSGKSTLRYRLREITAAGGDQLEGEDKGTDQLFATLDSTVRTININDGRKIMLVDTVGFVQNLPHLLVAAFKSTLDEVLYADLLLHIIDVSDPHYQQQMQAVDEVLGEIGAEDKNVLFLFNKIDIAKDFSIPLDLQHPYVAISAKYDENFDELFNAIHSALNKDQVEKIYHLPHANGKALQQLREETGILTIEYDFDWVEVRTLVNIALVNKFEQYEA
ncbi:MAG: GTPase HflX [Clostridia bacterium]